MLNGPILHLQFASQEEVCAAMVRIQEFYESPIPGIRGNVFTHLEYVAANILANGGKYDYDWNGFNIPGHVVREFFARFKTFTEQERDICRLVTSLGDTPFYLIATHDGDPDADVLDHELCHASWYLDSDYGTKALNAVTDFSVQQPDVYLLLRNWLLKRGYDESVLADEMNAYLATTPKEWWSEPDQGLTAEEGAVLWTAGAPFRELIGGE